MMAAWAFFAASGLPASSQNRVNQVKAAYLYNFGRFVKWPAGAAVQGDSFAVCVLGQDPFGATLDSTLAGEALDGKPVVIRRSQDRKTPRIANPVRQFDRGTSLKEILAAIDQASVLTVSDIPGFSRRGGIIQFIAEATGFALRLI